MSTRRAARKRKKKTLNIIPESETQGKLFSGTRDKRGEMLVIFLPIFVLNFQEKWPQEISRRILHIFDKGQHKILSARKSGSERARKKAKREGLKQIETDRI